MNIDKNLILVKGEDKTEKIIYCKYYDGKYDVTFDNNKTYSYNYNNIVWLQNPVELDGTTITLYIDNQPISGIIKILKFQDYIRLRYKTGYNNVYCKSDIVIEDSCLKNKDIYNCFEYLKRLADKVSVVNEDDISFLSKQYNKISKISPRSVLAVYLNPKPLKKIGHYIQPIFPFSYNQSQKDATEKALTEQISIIEGPPGTGKTQTILNIIANAIINKKTVAVVSNNNSATSNVLEKLQKYNLDFIAAYLGNSENKEKFFESQTGTYPDMTSWKMSSSALQSIKNKLEVSGKKLDEILNIQNRIAILKQELEKLNVEKEYYNIYYKESINSVMPYRALYKHNSDRVMSLWIEYQQTIENNQVVTLKYKLKNLIHYGIYNFKFYNNSKEKVIALFQKLYYELKVQELTKEINVLTRKLDDFNFKSIMNEYTENSMKLFKGRLAERFSKNCKRSIFSKDVLWKNFGEFIDEYPVLLSTTHSLRNCISENYLFDYVIIDESSQVDLVAGALALSCAKNAVIVGDLKQLPNVVPTEIMDVTKRIFENYKLNNAYSYYDNSILSSITKLFDDVPKTLLREHYRCHPKIIEFCNQKFYNNELIIMTNNNEEKALMLYKTAEGNHARGKLNQRQIDVIFEEIIPEQKLCEKYKSIGIISPYRLQADEIKKIIENPNIEADTVHKFQGRERDVIILSTVANEVNDFIDNANLINVAISRAINKLIVVVSDNDMVCKNSNIGDLIRYIQYNNFEIVNSNIYSVFDLLYSSYSEKLLEMFKKIEKVSQYKSENLMNAVIEKVLNLPQFQNLDKVLHLPLKMLIRDPSKLDDNECQFAMNILTHTDFVIFNKLDKIPVLVVEVDGYSYHECNPKQKERDKMKDEILKKYDIPILRLKTTESGEEVKLLDKLTEILNIS